MRLSRLKKNLMKFIIIPLLKNRNSWKASIKIVDDVTTKLLIGKPSDDKGDENNNEDSNNEDQDDGVFTSLTTVFKFIYTFMFGGVDQTTKQTLILPFASQCSSIFGKFISHDLRDAVINEYLSHVIPTEISEFKQFKKVANAVSRFQAEMRKMEFMRTPREGEDEEEVRTLGSYVARVDVLFIIKKRDKLLELGRKIMLEDNFESLLITEEEKESEIVIKENLEENANQGTIKSEIVIEQNIEENRNNGTIKSEDKDKFAIKTNNDDNPNEGWEVEWNEEWDDDNDNDLLNQNNEDNLLNQNNKNNRNEKSNEEISPQKLEKRLIQYSISVKSKDLIDLAINIFNEIKEIQNLNAKSGIRLYQTTLDLFDLYQAIMPIYHSNNLTDIPSLAMLFRNDCTWIAEQLLINQDKYSTVLSSLNDSDSEDIDKISYNEISDRLRELGDEWYNIQIDKQKSTIKDILEEIGGVQQTANDERFEICQRAMNQVIDTINRLSRTWKGVLRPSEYYSALGTLIDTPLIIMIDNLEDLYDISAEESHQLNLIYSILFTLENLFEPNTIENYTKSWKKYRQITDILELSFANIMNRFRASELDCFTTDELEGLICALFADTPLREQNLEEIRETRIFF
ncbi:6741_t:CDS:2 [Diversispora eburnea]|uniref:6741_t:CDS:1 n=1 Tax=Diversispora eburnea TaxID=1213867 RepID=A0A9N8VCH2_9GLOM|nr:6741_t:CDS:2 [Diversispora eburnea]